MQICVEFLGFEHFASKILTKRARKYVRNVGITCKKRVKAIETIGSNVLSRCVHVQSYLRTAGSRERVLCFPVASSRLCWELGLVLCCALDVYVTVVADNSSKPFFFLQRRVTLLAFAACGEMLGGWVDGWMGWPKKHTGTCTLEFVFLASSNDS